MIDPDALNAARARLADWPDWETRHNLSGPVRSLPKHLASPPPPDQRVSVGTESQGRWTRINAERRAAKKNGAQ